jgi:hypothetical protein
MKHVNFIIEHIHLILLSSKNMKKNVCLTVLELHELALDITQYLSQSHILNCLLTCKVLSTCLKPLLWRNVNIKDYSLSRTEHNRQILQQNSQFIHTLEISSLNFIYLFPQDPINDHAYLISYNFSQLRILRMENLDHADRSIEKEYTPAFFNFLDGCTQLKDLFLEFGDVDREQIDQILTRLPALRIERLNVYCNSLPVHNIIFSVLLGTCLKLKYLKELRYLCDDIDTFSFELPDLLITDPSHGYAQPEILTPGNGVIPASSLTPFLKNHGQNLSYLEIYNVVSIDKQVNEDIEKTIREHCPNLEELKFGIEMRSKNVVCSMIRGCARESTGSTKDWFRFNTLFILRIVKLPHP